jgi:hypothetical protein
MTAIPKQIQSKEVKVNLQQFLEIAEIICSEIGYKEFMTILRQSIVKESLRRTGSQYKAAKRLKCTRSMVAMCLSAERYKEQKQYPTVGVFMRA